MRTNNNNSSGNSLRIAFKQSALALAVAAGLATGSAQALTTTQTFDLGTSPARTTIQPGVAGLLPWFTKGSLPAGSILRSVSVNAQIEDFGIDALTDDWALDLNVYLDPSPEAPGTAALLQVGGYDVLGTPSLALTYNNSTGWANGDDGPVTAVTDTITDSEWAAIGPVDLSTVQISVGNDYSDASWSGTITIEYDVFEPAKITSFGPGAVVGELVANAADITWTLPPGTNVTALAPTFTLSSGSCDKDNGGPTTYDFTSPVVYTVTDGGTVNTYTVTVVIPDFLLWNVAGDGDWNLSTPNWLAQPAATPASFIDGSSVVFNNPAGGTITIDSGMSPLSTTVGGTGTYTFAGGPLAGGDLTVSAPGTLNISGGTFSGVVSISGDGAIVRNLGGAANQSLNYDLSSFTGTLTVTTGMTALNPFYSPSLVAPAGGTIRIPNNTTVYLGWQGTTFTTTVELAGSVDNGEGLGLLRGDTATLNGAILLSANSSIGSAGGTLTINAAIGDGGAGYGFTKVGTGTVILTGTNTYSGPTVVAAGTLRIDSPDALASGDLTINSGSAKVNLNYTGTKAIANLSLGGVPQANGIYGSLTSDATAKSASFEGSGTVTVGDPATFAFISAFGSNVAGSTAVIGPVDSNSAVISWIVPSGTALATLAPDFVLSPGATCSDQASGVVPTPNFSAGPVTYTIVSPDTLVTNIYTVTVTELPAESTLVWNLPTSGDWNYATPNWNGQVSGLPTVFVDETDVVFSNTAGGTITVPTSVTVSPGNMTVNAASGTYRWAGGAGNIGGTGTLTKSGAGILKIGQPNTSPVIPMLNTFSGGTIIDGGELWLEPTSNTGLGSGTVTLNAGTLRLYRINAANALIVNGGKLYTQNGFGNNWNGPVTLNTTLPIEPFHQLSINGIVSGPGGLTVQAQTSTVILANANNSYAGPTSVTTGTLRCNSPGSLGGSDLSITGGKLNLAFSGTKTVASLTLGGVAQTTPGTYGSVASGADFPSDTYFTTGSLGTVTIASASDYDAWLGGFTFAPGADTTPTGDPDGDGLSNEQEYAFGLNPTLGTSVNPVTQLLDPTTGTFSYTRRATPATTGLTYTVFTSSNLADWDPDEGSESITTVGDVETVTFTVTNPAVGGKLFVRVEAVPTAVE